MKITFTKLDSITRRTAISEMHALGFTSLVRKTPDTLVFALDNGREPADVDLNEVGSISRQLEASFSVEY